MNGLWILLGLVALYYGAEWLVKGSSEIALRIGLSPLVVGLTVVAFGTSAPELLVSVQANLQTPPKGDIALGNIVGSNICNIALILGVGALVRPIRVHAQVIRREMPILLIVTVAFVAMLWNNVIERWEGGILFAGILLYVWDSIRQARKESIEVPLEDLDEEQIKAAQKAGASRMALNIGLIVLGLGVLIGGAKLLITGGSYIALHFGVSEAVVGLSIVAFGTSLPELATSVVAAARNHGDIITGNAIGSCIFNILCVVGAAALILPLGANQLNRIDLGVMAGLTVILLPMLWHGRSLNRLEGGLLVAAYLGYVGYLAVR